MSLFDWFLLTKSFTLRFDDSITSFSSESETDSSLPIILILLPEFSRKNI